jgi:hypothetical protein
MTAIGRTGCVLHPLPKADAASLEVSIETLRNRGLVQGSRREPNLTLAGIDAARVLLDPASA